MSISISLSREVIQDLGVTATIKTYKGAQKYVFIVDCKYGRCALKAFTGFSKREIREIDFYQNNNDAYGIPKIIDLYENGPEPIVIEEFIEGYNPTPIPNIPNKHLVIRGIISQICKILDPFWKQGIVHRDLKPDNLIIRDDGSLVVIDFGIAHNPGMTTLTETNFQPNTNLYASPEQLLGLNEQVNYRSDFFSLGILAYKLNFDTFPFGDTKEEITDRFTKNYLKYHTSPTDPLNNFFSSVFHIDPSARPRNVKKLLGAL